jgi:hypothetical protein
MFTFFSDDFYKDLKEQIIEDSGKNLPDFLNSEILIVIIKRMIQDELDPATGLLENASVMVKKVVGQIIAKFFAQFPRLTDAITEEAHKVIDA